MLITDQEPQILKTLLFSSPRSAYKKVFMKSDTGVVGFKGRLAKVERYEELIRVPLSSMVQSIRDSLVVTRSGDKMFYVAHIFLCFKIRLNGSNGRTGFKPYCVVSLLL
ncbi:unnamed protein product [Cuscuta epithymum]|uniref:Uncharacterized protein n=1 Tax=Cuscuta epithymum TaxID=186058 RepID=A0AAV0FI71_9ASTE|nr:unnamed protein product [Cuscuta epithymum]